MDRREYVCNQMYKQHDLLRKGSWTDADKLEYMELNIAPYSRYWRMGMKKALKHAIRLLREEEEKADRKTEPTISKMEQVEDEPQTDEEYINNLPWTEVGNGEQTDNLFTDKDGDVWEWRGDAWYCISGDEPQTEDFKACVEGLTLLWIYNYVTDDEFHRIDARLKCKDEPHIVGKHADMVIIDEPQTEQVGVPFGEMDEATFKSHCLNCQRDTADIKCLDCDGNKYFLPYGSKTDCAWK